MTTMDPDLNEIYNFLRVEQGNGTTPKNIFERMKDEVAKRAKLLVNTKLKDTNLIAAINAVVISAAAYQIKIRKVSYGESNEFDRIIKKELRAKIF